MLAPDRKRRLPPHPRCVGVVTSPVGAALHDILHVMGRRAPWTRVVIRGCRVQGDGAAEEIAAAIRCLSGAGCADLLIIGRGGGSVEDLWAFNQEVVARALAECRIPTISAVGHETDVTIADLVADLRAPTPSAAAEAAVPDRPALQRELENLRLGLVRAQQRTLRDGRQRCTNLERLLDRSLATRLSNSRSRLATAAARLNALSPLAAMGRGYAVPLAADGSLLRNEQQLRDAGTFRLRMVDGSVPCAVRDENDAEATP